MYPGEWKGTVNQKKGTAIFMVDGKQYCLDLYSFDDFNQISEMLESANKMGKEFGATAVYDAAINAANKRKNELHS